MRGGPNGAAVVAPGNTIFGLQFLLTWAGVYTVVLQCSIFNKNKNEVINLL